MLSDAVISDDIVMVEKTWFNTVTASKLLFSARSVRMAELLLAKGADVNCILITESVMHLAARRNQIALLDLFLRYGADINILSSREGTPLHVACANSKYETVKFLLARNADINSYNCNQNTPLHYAVFTVNVNILKLLLNAGADRTLLDSEGRTPLMLAQQMSISAISPRKEIVQLLME